MVYVAHARYPVVVADTDLLIDYLTDAAPGAIVGQLLEEERLYTTVISLCELRAGMRADSPQFERFEAILAVHSVPLDIGAALEGGALSQRLRQQGQPIAIADVLIAGICRHLNLPLATRNRAHFERVEGLELVDF